MEISSRGSGKRYGPIEDKLQSLAPEVRRHLLSLLDLSQLRGLVHASPVYHQQYLHDRHYILSSSIEVTLSGVTADAYAVHVLSNNTTGPKPLSLLSDIYKKSSTPLLRNLTQEECVGMARFYFSVRRVAEHFSRWLLDDFAKFTDQPRQEELSTMETLRIIRASYRFEVMCRLAALDDLFRSSEARGEDIMSFFHMIEPWEVDEMLSFCQFAEGVYDSIFSLVKDDLHPNNSRFDHQHRPPTPEGAFVLDGFDRRWIIEGTMLNGITLLNTVLFGIKDHEHLVTTMQKAIITWDVGLNRVSGILGESQLSMRRQGDPSDRDRLELLRTPLPFRGDVEAGSSGDVGGQLCPPLAWTVIWGGTYSNMYGWFTSDELRRWGYVFWDAARIQSTDAKERLEALWDMTWDGIDPRDEPDHVIVLPED